MIDLAAGLALLSSVAPAGGLIVCDLLLLGYATTGIRRLFGCALDLFLILSFR